MTVEKRIDELIESETHARGNAEAELKMLQARIAALQARIDEANTNIAELEQTKQEVARQRSATGG